MSMRPQRAGTRRRGDGYSNPGWLLPSAAKITGSARRAARRDTPALRLIVVHSNSAELRQEWSNVRGDPWAWRGVHICRKGGGVEVLKLDGADLTVLSDAVGDLRGLKRISLRGCALLGSLPEAIGRLSNLSVLDLSGCPSLVAMPDAIGDLTARCDRRAWRAVIIGPD